jgi:hypothetical protein
VERRGWRARRRMEGEEEEGGWARLQVLVEGLAVVARVRPSRRLK